MSAVGPYRRYPSGYMRPGPPEAPPRPTSRFTFEPEAPVVGDEVVFDASSSGGPVERYEWQEVTTGELGEGVVVRLVFASAGRKTMILNVRGPGGQHSSGQNVDVVEA